MFPQVAITNYHKLDSLKTTEIYSLRAVEARSLKSRCRKSHAPSEGLGKTSSLPLPSFWQLPAILSIPLLQSLALFSHRPSSLSISTVSLYPNLPLLSHIKILVIGFRAKPNPVFSFDYICKKNLFPNKGAFKGLVSLGDKFSSH